jgi:hypothetical protein
LAPGYEDLNDHDYLAKVQMLAIAVGKSDPTGMDRKAELDRGRPLAGKSTLNRLELTPAEATARSPYKKTVVSPESVDDLFVDIFLESSGFSDRDRLEYAINVNAITPGYMATDNTATIRADENRNRLILERIPDGRWGEPDDLQGCAVFLASPASDYVHGYTFAVDGGWLAR